MSERSNNESTQNICSILLLVIVLIALVSLISWGGWRYCNTNYNSIDNFADNVKNSVKSILKNENEGILYNPLYSSPDLKDTGSFLYTQPPGDVTASDYAKTIQGTSGEFLPLQGRHAGVFMKNSSQENAAMLSEDLGTIGGFPNYTEKLQTSAVNAGFNDFGSPFQSNTGAQLSNEDYSNSYTINGANERVCNPGQKCNGLESQDWWPIIKKGKSGFSTQASDSMVECDGNTIEECMDQGGSRFLKSKMEPRWKSVFTGN